MCLALPAKVTKLIGEDRAIINLGGVTKEISLGLLEKVTVGDYVIIHVGYALAKLDENEAKKTLKLFADMVEVEQLV